MKRVAVAPVIFFFLFAAGLRANFHDGLEAYKRGDFAAALAEWQPLADNGDANAQYNVGLMYTRGQGVSQDLPKAVEWYEKAAAQGVAAAQYNLGVLYSNGQGGVPLNVAEARKWLEKAATQGIPEAQYSLGTFYGDGQGVPRDYAEAEKWYRKAADAGIADAQFSLGLMYDLGEGVPRNYDEALKWYRMAADGGSAGALCNIGILYYNNEGVSRNLVESYSWISRCEKSGDPRAGQLRRILESRMSRRDIERGQQLAAGWHPSVGRSVAEPELFVRGEGTKPDGSAERLMTEPAEVPAQGTTAPNATRPGEP